MSLPEVAQFVAGGLELCVRQNICFKEATSKYGDRKHFRLEGAAEYTISEVLFSGRPRIDRLRLGFVQCLLLQIRRVLLAMTCLLYSLRDPMTTKFVSGKPGVAYAHGQLHALENLE